MRLRREKLIFTFIFFGLFLTCWLLVQASGIFNIDENAQVQDLVICNRDAEVIYPDRVVKKLASGDNRDLFLCGKLISKYPAKLILNWIQNDEVVNVNDPKIDPGNFQIPIWQYKNLVPGSYRIEFWYWHELRAQIDFEVKSEP